MRSPRSCCWLAAEMMVRDGGAMAVGMTGGVATSAIAGAQARRPYMTMEIREVFDPLRMVNQLAMDLCVVDLPSSVCRVCPELVTASPPPGTYGRVTWEESGRGVPREGEGREEEEAGGGGGAELCWVKVSSSLSPMAGKPSVGDGGIEDVVPAGMRGWGGTAAGPTTISGGTIVCSCEELEAARLSRFLLDT